MTQQPSPRQSRELISCAQCGTPVVERQGEVYVLVVRHHGEKHVTVLPAPPSSVQTVPKKD